MSSFLSLLLVAFFFLFFCFFHSLSLILTFLSVEPVQPSNQFTKCRYALLSAMGLFLFNFFSLPLHLIYFLFTIDFHFSLSLSLIEKRERANFSVFKLGSALLSLLWLQGRQVVGKLVFNLCPTSLTLALVFFLSPHLSLFSHGGLSQMLLDTADILLNLLPFFFFFFIYFLYLPPSWV